MRTNSRMCSVPVAILCLALWVTTAHAHYSPGQGRWLSRDPLGEAPGPAVYGFVGNDPGGHVDRLGEDFIAVGGRPLKRAGWLLGGLGFMRHLSVEYWRYPCPLKKGEVFDTNDVRRKARRQGMPFKLERIIQLYHDERANMRWHAWHYSLIRDPHSRQEDSRAVWGWRDEAVMISYIDKKDTSPSTSFSVIEQAVGPDASTWLTAGWSILEYLTDSYQYAEAQDFSMPVRWPNSRYTWLGNNSNTFVRWLMRMYGESLPDLWGHYPGNDSPQPVNPREWGPVFHGTGPTPPHP